MVATVQENPLRAGAGLRRTPEPVTMVIFGATGDLAHRKLIPALYNLAVERMLPHGFSIIGFSRPTPGVENFREDMRQAVDKHSRYGPVNDQVWNSFAEGLFFVPGDFDDPACYEALKTKLEEVDQQRGTEGNRLFYLATPPTVFTMSARNLHKAGLITPNATGNSWTRIVIEKPFGRNLESARKLNAALLRDFHEDQIYRIDHYLGKETVQNLLVFRFANGIFEPIWNRRYIDNVQITVAEALGIDRRGGYFETAGALRDMVQSHMLQLLTNIAMEPPAALDAQAIRDEKVKVLRSVLRYTPEQISRDVVRGQYGPGWIGGQPVPGYRSEAGVSPQSTTETFVALKMCVDNWRWAGVPFYLRTGKRLPKQETEIAIVFKRPPLTLFADLDPDAADPNILTVKIQPDEGISLKFVGKVPGPGVDLQPVSMDFLYGTSFSTPSADAYERLLLDAMLGDSMLFTRKDEVEQEWEIVTPILDAWEHQSTPDFPNYEAGTWGPQAAIDLIGRDGHCWRKV